MPPPSPLPSPGSPLQASCPLQEEYVGGKPPEDGFPQPSLSHLVQADLPTREGEGETQGEALPTQALLLLEVHDAVHNVVKELRGGASQGAGHLALSRPLTSAPGCGYLLSRALGHALRDGVDLAGDLHTSSGHTHQEDPEVGAPQVQGQEVPTLCGAETLSARSELEAPPPHML